MSVMFVPRQDLGTENRNGKLRNISVHVNRQSPTSNVEGVILTPS